jgi:outer membrane protein TolC
VMGLITIPIWDGGARYGAHRVAKVQVEEDEQRIASAERQGNQQITQAMRGIEVADTSERLGEEARDLAKENARLAQLAFTDGAGTSFDLVDATGKLRQAELNLAVQQLSLTRAKITALLSTANCQY